MILAMMLFGLNLDPLFLALAEVESTSGTRSANVYQINDLYIKDVNRITSHNTATNVLSFQIRDKYSKYKSQDMMLVYWKYYGSIYRDKTGKTPTFEVLSRIHNGGPVGYDKPSTTNYWNKVRRALDKLGANY